MGENKFNLYAELASDHFIEDFYEVKGVDRKLSCTFVVPSSIICDAGGSTEVDSFPLAMLSTYVFVWTSARIRSDLANFYQREGH